MELANHNQAIVPCPKAHTETKTDIVLYGMADSAIGPILVARGDQGMKMVSIGASYLELIMELEGLFPGSTLINGDGLAEQYAREIARFIELPSRGLDLPLEPQGTAFQRRVWTVLRSIPVGTTITYTELAIRLGDPKSVRAVASACAANPIAIAIPCHRVIGRDGGLTGYRWGLDRKKLILEREANS